MMSKTNKSKSSPQKTPDLCVILSSVSYDENTGFLHRVSRGCEPSKSVAGCKRKDGYVVISIKNKLYLAHRIAWKIFHGSDADGLIDHINRNPGDNRISNLRLADHQQNSRNCKVSSANKSGFTGVSWFASANKWRASATISGKSIHLGLFDSADDAKVARDIFVLKNYSREGD